MEDNKRFQENLQSQTFFLKKLISYCHRNSVLNWAKHRNKVNVDCIITLQKLIQTMKTR